MIRARRQQRSFGEGLIAAEVKDLHEAWMPHVDAILADDTIVAAVHQALAQRHPNSRGRGRRGFSAEVVLRLLILKHLCNWSYQVLEREVRAAIDTHEAKLGRVPRLVAADAGFYSAKNEVAAKAKGVKRVCIPNHTSKNDARKREQKKRWFGAGQRWCPSCEGRISVTKRRHGLNRCRYHGEDGMKRWVGLGVIADNLINLGQMIDKQPATQR